MSDATERLRQKAQNEQACIALNDLLNTKDAALAAKDARIAELEGVLAKALAFTEANTFGGTDALELIEECHTAIAGQQQPGPATHSEDGREVPEVVGSLIEGEFFHCVQNGPGNNPLMTVAQHERIVAEKDAELKELRGSMAFRTSLIGRLEAERDELRELLARSTLAPAAVVEIDIVEALIQAIDAEQERLSNEDSYLMDSDDCIKVIRETVARLNRRAIPAGLLEKLAHCTDPDCCIAHARSQLRALLGKEGECRHQRTHYSQRNGGEHVCSNCGESANDAQPARQVGGDVYKQHPAIIGYARKSDLAPLLDKAQPGGSHICIGLDHPTCWEDEPPYDHLVPLYISATLAPAAVVMPCRADERQSERYMNGWNSALDEVARLNRRAIPAGLLERIQVELDDYHSMDLIGTHGCDDELRALLGKDGSQ